MASKRSALLALTDSHHGFFKGAARYAREHGWQVVADMIRTAKTPVGWRGNGILSPIGDRDDLAELILSSGLLAVEISMARNVINLPRLEGDSELIGCLAAEHFLERGFRHFAWAPFLDDVVDAERYRGFANRLAQTSFSIALRAKANSVRANPDKRASKGGPSRPCGPGGGRSVAEAAARPAGAGGRARQPAALGPCSPR